MAKDPTQRFPLAAAAALLLIANNGSCNGDPEPWTLDEIPAEAMVFVDPGLANDPDFSLRNVLATIIRTGQATPGGGAEEALIESLVGSFRATRFINSGLPMRVDARSEANLTGRALLDGPNKLVPIALFNRVDAMPKDASDCGEYRIVYSDQGSNFLLIFEAKLPNLADKSPARCAAFARRWAQAASGDPAQRLAGLKQLYFTGGEGLPGVVNAAHYGDRLGQVRSNSVTGGPWMLREWRVIPQPGKVVFKEDTVKSNPLVEFYQDNNNGTAEPTNPAQEQRRREFHSELANVYAKQLVQVDQELPADMSAADLRLHILGTFGAKVDDKFNEFQSDAESSDQIAGKIGNLAQAIPEFASADGQRKVDRRQLQNRAQAITCGGCHNSSNNADVGTAIQPLRWPSSLGFRHVMASSPGAQLSPALTEVLIPVRRRFLVDFLNRMKIPKDRAAAERPGAATVPSAAFVAIVRGQDKRVNALDDYERRIKQMQQADIAKEGYFMKNRRPH